MNRRSFLSTIAGTLFVPVGLKSLFEPIPTEPMATLVAPTPARVGIPSGWARTASSSQTARAAKACPYFWLSAHVAARTVV
jgi:hypothetical protein